MIINVLTVLMCAAAGLFIPGYAYKYACWKNKKRGKEKISTELWKGWKIVFPVVILALGYMSFENFPGWKAIFILVFVLFGVFGIVVDSLIRIIGNEMLLIMLVVGIIYRGVDGGVRSYIGSALGLGIVIAVLLVSAVVTYFFVGARGVGMGDIKLCIVAAVTVGFPGTLYFMLGMAVAMLAYVLLKIVTVPAYIHSIFHVSNTFPMCGVIMAGFITGMVYPVFMYNFMTGFGY